MAAPVEIHPISPDIVSESASAENIPHRHEYQEAVVLTAGRSIHEIDGQELRIAAPSVLLVAQGKIHRIRLAPGSQGWVIRFGNETVPNETVPLFSQFMDASTIALENRELRRPVLSLVELLAGTTDCSSSQVRRHLLAAFLAMLLEESRRLAAGRSVGSEDYETFHRFLKRLDRSFATRKDVDFYASDLGLTPKRLSALCQAMFGKTTSKIIEERSVIEAKRLLAYTSDDVRQIALAVGFSDHSYFSRLFRKASGLSPSEYRSHHSVFPKSQNPSESS